MTDSTLTPPAADMMSFLSTTPEHKDSEYETPYTPASARNSMSSLKTVRTATPAG
ncbi:membrane protein [Salmonella enterica subsp. enterica]|nr:membrane protein [Salmonella enterica subsp. enterica] [Salmonella enterica subsp. enterica serovar Menston]